MADKGLQAVEDWLKQIIKDAPDNGYADDLDTLIDGLTADLKATAFPQELNCSDCDKKFTSYIFDLCPECIAGVNLEGGNGD